VSVDSYSNEIDIVGKLTKIITDIQLLIILDKKGNLLSYLCSEDCTKDHDLTDFRNLAKLVSIRYRIGGFDKLLGGLETTINVFKNKTLFVRGLQDDNILVVSVPKKYENLADTLNAIQTLKHKTTNVKNSTSLKRVASGITNFQKNQKKLLPKMHMLVAANLQPEYKHIERRIYGSPKH